MSDQQVIVSLSRDEAHELLVAAVNTDAGHCLDTPVYEAAREKLRAASQQSPSEVEGDDSNAELVKRLRSHAYSLYGRGQPTARDLLYEAATQLEQTTLSTSDRERLREIADELDPPARLPGPAPFKSEVDAAAFLRFLAGVGIA